MVGPTDDYRYSDLCHDGTWRWHNGRRPRIPLKRSTVVWALNCVTRDVMVQVPGGGVPCVWFSRYTLYLQAIYYTKWLLQYRIVLYRFPDCNCFYCWNDGFFYTVFLHRAVCYSLFQKRAPSTPVHWHCGIFRRRRHNHNRRHHYVVCITTIPWSLPQLVL